MNTFIGGILGFVIGLIAVKIILRDKKPEELRTDKELKRKYGLLVWGTTLLGTLIGYAL